MPLAEKPIALAPRPEGPRKRATRRRRASILDAALQLFGEQGYGATSLRDVAQRVGITHTGVIYHFPTKEALLEAVLDRRDEEVSRYYELRADDPVAVLRNLVSIAQENEQQRETVELFATLAAEATDQDHPAHDYFVRRYTGLLGFLEEKLTEAQEHGLLRDSEMTPRTMAQEIVAVMDGLQLQWLLRPDSLRLSESVRRYLQRFVTIDLSTVNP